ncbi:serine/threonine protein kinase [Helicocarpus griseus UAMH5409]|uniref:Serine/threonine protein kinase n=1 Tax=Helicocarpus griseus UAMH5409 TaxID=1447875 RepID=A0A2B7XDF8_9EURO|nr:serine/threonine protein kinase [Helicocarpus griseus UAMH5409]
MESTPQPKQYPVKTHGDLVSPCWIQTHLEGSDCEYLINYNEGGLCPVVMDDVLSGSDLIHGEKPCSFKILGKLGWGSYSNVWLGREITSGKHLALKILRKEHSTLDNSELSILRKLGKLEVAFFHTHVPTQNRFLCLGLKPLGCTLRERVNAKVHAPSDLSSLTTFVKTLLMKVLDFHEKGVCHGDISPNNISFGVLPEALTEEGLRETFEEDLRSDVLLWGAENLDNPPPRPANLPEYVVCRYGTPLKADEEDMSKVEIIDFGKSLNKGFETRSKTNVLGTHNYCAPELDRDGANTTTAKSDLWSLGCVFYYAVKYKHLFHDDDDLERYLTETHEAQVSFIHHQLSGPFLNDIPEYLYWYAELIHSLVRVDPKERDPEKAKENLENLEAWSMYYEQQESVE